MQRIHYAGWRAQGQFNRKVVYSGGRVKNIKDISGLNIRFAKEIKGCGKSAKYIRLDGFRLQHADCFTAAVRKDNDLRDLARYISNGECMTRGLKVGIVDERSEIASCRNGVPQFDVGTAYRLCWTDAPNGRLRCS